MVNKPLRRPSFLGGVALGGVARIPMTICWKFRVLFVSKLEVSEHRLCSVTNTNFPPNWEQNNLCNPTIPKLP